ncbi:hypothetical protein O181_025957 [Austropuccinia psidii MF-1]|uniref:WHIM1 domain-containing protein n=1 Tax=Austropuccinia psidii MF-1 TaxID=1389203 RepID=A0A9Q3CPL8_9BASI|nr:hypothetical protein [Austropuccinia psidii MF-1]
MIRKMASTSNHDAVKALRARSSSITSTDAASAPLPITHPASVLPLNSEEPLKSTQSWETAYVFAFIYKFTSLCHDLKIGLRFRTAFDLEEVLQVDTRNQEATSAQDTNLINAQEILTEILMTFYDNLKSISANNWEKWLKAYVEDIINHELANPILAQLNWKENYVRTRKNGFWDLTWNEKVHLLKVLVDRQLTYSPKIKAMVDENYEKALIKPTKQAANIAAKSSSVTVKPFQNPLLIKPLGVDRNFKTWWQIDDSPRVYRSGNPYKSPCTWEVLSTTNTEFLKLKSSLASDSLPHQLETSDCPSPIESLDSKQKPQVKKLKIPLMFINPSTNLSPSKRDKKQDQGIKLELQLNRALEEIAQPNIQAGEQQKQELIRRQEKLDQQEAKKRRKIDLINAQPNLTRSTPGFGLRSRLRSLASKPDYVVDSDSRDKEWERGLREYEKAYTPRNFNKDGQPGKQKCLGGIQCSQTSSEDAEDQISKHSDLADEEEEGEYDAMADEGSEFSSKTSNNGRSSHKHQNDSKKRSTTKSEGERRSSRVRTKHEADVEETSKLPVDEEVPQPLPPIWSRAQAPNVPHDQVNDSIGSHASNQDNLNGNVSVWSRGKLVYVAGNNKYVSKPVTAPKKKIIAKPGSGVVLKTISSFPQDLTPSGAASGSLHALHSNSLASLQARLSAMTGDEEEEDNTLHLKEKTSPAAAKEGITVEDEALSSLFDDLKNETLGSEIMNHETAVLSGAIRSDSQSSTEHDGSGCVNPVNAKVLAI